MNSLRAPSPAGIYTCTQIMVYFCKLLEWQRKQTWPAKITSQQHIYIHVVFSYIPVILSIIQDSQDHKANEEK